MKSLNILKSAVAVAALSVAGSAFAVPVSVGFNFTPLGGVLTANNGGDITVATAVTFTGGVYQVNGLDTSGATTNNIGLAVGNTTVTLTNPMPLNVGSAFTKTFVSNGVTFTESLVITTLLRGASSSSITASGTLTGAGFDATPVFFSASYTQNGGPSGQINASFNNSTANPVRIPEPTSLALVGLALAGVGLSSRRRAAK